MSHYRVGQFPATDEQAQAISLAMTRESVKIEAGAGAGKSTTLTAIAEYCGGKSLYIAYNKSVATEAARLFPKTVTCATAHSLAYKAYGKLYKERLGGTITARMISDFIDLTEAPLGIPPETWCFLLMQTTRNFMYSGDRGITGRHAPEPSVNLLPERGMLPIYRSRIAGDARKLWTGMVDVRGHLPISHDVYLKLWADSRPTLPFDRILYDEAQDANAPMMAAVQRQQAQQIWVGDRYQTIYSWRGAVNAMEQIKTAHTTQITQSFRFGPAIAELANRVLSHWRGADFRIRGFGGVESRIAWETPERSPDVILCRTNAVAVESLITQVEAGQTPLLIGDVAGMVRLLKGIGALIGGRRAFAPELAGFSSIKELRDHVAAGEAGSMGTLLGLMYRRKLGDLIKSLTNAKKQRKPTVTICTAHKSKGLQWSVVQLANDFPAPPGTDDRPYTDEEANLLYVAVTRAMNVLDVSRCEAVQQLVLDDVSRHPTEKPRLQYA